MSDVVRPRRPAIALRSGVSGVVVGALTWALLTAGAVVVPQGPAQAAEESSAVTVRAIDYDLDHTGAPFPDLAVTVSQTQDLVSQGITVSWTGGVKSQAPDSSTGGENFLQILQCWGEDAAHPGHPDRTTCQYGAFRGRGGTRDDFRSAGTVAAEDEQYSVPGDGAFNPPYTSIPFQSVTGDVVASVVNNQQVNVDVNVNPYFSSFTSNEVPWAGSAANGTGTVKFEVQTAQQATGLGCGNPVAAADGGVTGQSCWLVIIPRGTADVGEQDVVNSGLFWDAWEHHLAVKLDFRALGVRCPIGAAERQVAGSELAGFAVSSWQPALCTQTGGSIYSQLTMAESDALGSASRGGDAPLALTSLAMTDTTTDPLRYAPVALTGVAVAFALDRQTSALGEVPPEVAARNGTAVTTLRLTPRLLAKLLTSSYRDALPSSGDRSHIGYVNGSDPGDNPRNILRDPEFLEINDPEWQYQSQLSASVADLLVPQGRSDAAWAVWSYILADPDARAFLAGEPDENGMIVNPWWSIDKDVNLSGTALELPRSDFPKADPIEGPGPDDALPINLVTLRPYTNDLAQSATLTLRGDGLILGPWDSQSVPPKYQKLARNLPGSQKVLSLTETPASSRYQVFTAELLNPAGEFVAPTTESLAAAAAAMTTDPRQAQVLRFDPASTAARGATTAYPLAMPVYAAARPDLTDAALRGDYADFIRYAVGAGQAPGVSEGQLPPGYAPIPEAWKTAALSAATAIAAGPQPTASPSPSSGSNTQQLPTLPVDEPEPAQPEATGDPSGDLAGEPTPDDGAFLSLSSASAVPWSAAAAAVAGLASAFLGRRRRIRTWPGG